MYLTKCGWSIKSDSPGLNYGGRIYIYDDTTLAPAATAVPTPAVIDLGEATSALCRNSTGANPVRPHMLLFNASQTHAVLAFVASGHVAIFNAVIRTPLACFRTSVGAGGARKAHAAIPSADGTFILVANQNGKMEEVADRLSLTPESKATAGHVKVKSVKPVVVQDVKRSTA